MTTVPVGLPTDPELDKKPKYPKAVHGNYYGMSDQELKELFEDMWEDDYTILIGHILVNAKASKKFLHNLKKPGLFSIIKKIITKMWVDGNITYNEADTLYDMFMSTDEENYVLASEILKAKFPRVFRSKL